MTAYEMGSLHAQLGDNINAQFSNWLAILSLYLGAGYLIAHRLSLSSAVALTGVFVVLLGVFTFSMFRTLTGFVGLSREIRALAEQGKGLEWHAAATMPAWALDLFTTNAMVMLWLAIVGAVYFFFSSRRQNLKTQPLAV